VRDGWAPDSVQFQIRKNGSSIRLSGSPDYAELGHFELER